MAGAPTALSARSASRTILAQFAARAITLGVVVASTAIVARTVGVEVYADWATVLSLVALLAVALDPGVTPVVVRRLAQDPDTAPRPEALRRARLAMGLAARAAVVGITAALRGPDALLLAAVLGGQVVPRALVLNATPWLQVDHRLHRQTALEAVSAGVGLAGLASAAALGAGAEVLALVGFLLPTALLAGLVRLELRRTPSFRLPSPGPQREKVKEILREIGPLAAALVLTTVYTRINTVFVNVAEDAAGVAQFLFAFQFVEQAIVAAGIVAAALLPMIAVRAREVDLLRDGVTTQLCLAMVALGGIGTGILIALAGPLCRLIGGGGLAPASVHLQALAPMATLIMLAFTLGYLHVALEITPRYLWINAVALGVGLALHAVLTLAEGAPAAARIAWVVEGVVVVLGYLPFWRAGATGRRVGLLVLAIFAIAVVGSELAAREALHGAAAGAIVAAAALAIGARALRRTVGPAIGLAP